MANYDLVFAMAIYVFLLSTMSQTRASSITKTGFMDDLIHVDSPSSPFYNVSQSDYDRLHNAFIRYARNNPENELQYSTLSETLVSGGGSYYMDVSFRTPPVKTSLIMDTGSSLIWTQCQPCINCYKQRIPTIFDPRLSSTFLRVPCTTVLCKDYIRRISSCSPENLCAYHDSYIDGSFSKGILSKDTLTFGSFSLANSYFGCGYDNQETDSGSGILGLGRSPLSLINQLDKSYKHRFSYCLSAAQSTSKIYFGSDAIVSGDGVLTTPMVLHDQTNYYLTLMGIVVGGSPFSASGTTMMIDSGCTCTYLPTGLYIAIAGVLDAAIKSTGVRAVGPYRFLKLCYESKVDLINVSKLTFAFANNANVEIITPFLRMSSEVVCLMIVPRDGMLVFGNIAQRNYMVGYDLEKQVNSFKPKDCNAS